MLCATAIAQAPTLPRAAEPGVSETIAAWLDDKVSRFAQLYKELHQSPELSLAEEKTAQRMAANLRKLSFDVTEHVGGTGVVGVLKNGDGPTLLLRADMDALPVVEETGLDYGSKVRMLDQHGATVGVMHACGHDMHMTMLTAALDYLASHRDSWQGTIVAMFQPAEERGLGAQAMLDDGLLRKFPKPKFALALHVAADRSTGKIGCRTGYALANVDSVDITIKGRGGHGAYPHTTIDPIVIAARLVMDLQTIVAREVNPVQPAVVTVGSIHGGTKHNIIGDECQLQLTVRSHSPEVRKQLIAAIQRKVKAACDASDAPEAAVDVSEGTPALYNSPELAARILPAVRRAIGDENVIEIEPSMGGEDFGRLHLAGVPIVMLSVGSIPEERMKTYGAEGGAPSLHSPKYYPEIEPTLRTGVTALVSASLELLPRDK